MRGLPLHCLWVGALFLASCGGSQVNEGAASARDAGVGEASGAGDATVDSGGRVDGAPDARPDALEGRDAIRQYYQAIASACATLRVVADQVFTVDNRAAVKFTLMATGKNGRTARAEGIDTFELDDDGLIRSLWVYYDPAPVMATLQE